MSLLLDALKKAADDKQKASQRKVDDEAISKSSDDNAVSKYKSQNSKTQELDKVDVNDQDDLSHDAFQSEVASLKDEELTLEEVVAPEREFKDDVVQSILSNSLTNAEQKKASYAKNQHTEKFYVSDEALTLLINNTNKDVSRGRALIGLTVLATSLFIVVAGGNYYYLDSQDEMATMERNHQLAMRSMQSKTNKESSIERSAVIRDLISDVDLNAKVKNVKTRIADVATIKLPIKKQGDVSTKVKAPPPNFTLRRSKMVDPIGDTLDAAWQAYDNRQYDLAKDLYNKVLSIEENNRDALMGIGAIALMQEERAIAKYAYSLLLKLDPNDAIASTALSRLQGDKNSPGSEEAYLLSMLEKNPDAPQLHNALGNVYARQDKWKLAQQSYFSAWQIDSENADYTFNLAVSMDQLNKPQQALNFYKDSLLKSKDKQVSFSPDAVKKRIADLTEL